MPRLPHLASLTSLASLALATLLAACSDGSLDHDLAAGQTRSAEAARARPMAVALPTAPLLDDEGHLYPATPQALPADTGARTRGGYYATPAQAAQLEDAMGTGAIPVNVEPGPDAAGAVELALQIVFGLQAAHDLRFDAPVLVRSSDPRLAATTVNQLEEHGFSRVFLVHPEPAGRAP